MVFEILYTHTSGAVSFLGIQYLDEYSTFVGGEVGFPRFRDFF
jgi:hypothetical protein